MEQLKGKFEPVLDRARSTFGPLAFSSPLTPQIIRSPLRISPLGAHIDHQGGMVTGMTIDKSIFLCFAPALDDTIYLESLQFPSPVSFRLREVPPHDPSDWGNYIRGAALALMKKFEQEGEETKLRGFVGVVDAEMPIGGLSSSAAVSLAFLRAFQAANSLHLTQVENVKLVQFIENRYIGLKNGVLDQTTILYSSPNHLTLIDCNSFPPPSTEHGSPLSFPSSIPLGKTDQKFEILIVYCGKSRILAGTAYNERVSECRKATQELFKLENGKECLLDGSDLKLRLISPETFERHGHKLPHPLNRRATHFFSENERVKEGVIAWQEGDIVRFGKLMTASGESSVKNYESGSPQLTTLYEILRETEGVYGTRFSGGGFGGSCIALIDPSFRDSVSQLVLQRYEKAFPDESKLASVHHCQLGDSVQLIS
mmetsp:Transcript_29598/g.40871  ORF Transcript_29598/g.40871 Transcript_29598/m.40871 type:complete len:427 (+) Transcript_29598:121-1401(+)